MSLEVQTFFLCANVQRHPIEQTNFNAERVGQHTLSSSTGRFPMTGGIPFYLLVRRDTRSGQDTYRTRFRLIDEDGHPVGDGRGLRCNLEFPDGERFSDAAGNISLEIPKPGSYRLEITMEADMENTLYHYDFDVLPSLRQ